MKPLTAKSFLQLALATVVPLKSTRPAIMGGKVLSKQNPKVEWKIPRRSREMSSAVGVAVPEVTSVVERE